MEIIELTNKDYKKIKKIIKKYNYDSNYIFTYNAINKIEKDDSNIKMYDVKTVDYWMILIVNALNIKDKKEKYKYIYDTMCSFLDNNVCVHCNFQCDKCEAQRCKKAVKKVDGCCYFLHVGRCEFLVDKKCTKKSISCKLFMCSYMEHKYKFKSEPKYYPLINLFFNRKQQDILRHTYRKNFEDIIDDLLLKS